MCSTKLAPFLGVQDTKNTIDRRYSQKNQGKERRGDTAID